MDRIDRTIFTHLDLEDRWGTKSNRRSYSVSDVAEDDGLQVRTYRELLQRLAKIGHENPKYMLLFRGQAVDWQYPETKQVRERSTVYPSIFRPLRRGSRLPTHIKKRRFKKLHRLAAALTKGYSFPQATKVKRFQEIQWALLQHYEVAKTPLVDVTQSVRVAATFALPPDRDEGYFYAFAVPYVHGSISYFVDERLSVVKLQAACPAEALRAHFQEAFFVGSFPHTEVRNTQQNLANRMVAKFRLRGGGFWGDGFERLPQSFLFPEDDVVSDLMGDLDKEQ